MHEIQLNIKSNIYHYNVLLYLLILYSSTIIYLYFIYLQVRVLYIVCLDHVVLAVLHLASR